MSVHVCKQERNQPRRTLTYMVILTEEVTSLLRKVAVMQVALFLGSCR